MNPPNPPAPAPAPKPTPTLGNYAKSLGVEIQRRYESKIEVLAVDPYLLLEDPSKWSVNFIDFPDVSSTDVYNYLVLGISLYTGDQFKAYKSLEAYKYCEDGFMRNVRYSKIQSVYLLCGQVLHGQKLSETPLSPWVIISNNGSIISGHCTCMAGLGECCSHVGALLFFVEGVCRRRKTPGLTEEIAYWVPPSGYKVADNKRLCNIDFRSSTKKLKGDGISEIKFNVAEFSDTNFQNLLEDFTKVAAEQKMNPTYLCLTTGIPQKEEDQFPVVLNRLFREEYGELLYEELTIIGLTLDFTLTPQQCEYIENNSKRQRDSTQWFNFRAGRVTASVAHAACRVKAFDSNKSLISKICYPSQSRVKADALNWGCNHEGTAVREYVKLHSGSHKNFLIKSSGLIISPKYPYLGASPDSLVSCDCCGEGCLEVKCPFCCTKGKSVNDMPYLIVGEDGKKTLNPTLSYFYQIQVQIFLSKSKYGDFFIWSPHEPPFYERLSLSEEVIAEIIAKSEIFFRNSLLPELLGKYFSRQDTSAPGQITDEENPFCVCQTSQKGKTIVCTKTGCRIVKYHLKCLKISRMPRSKKWVCPYCKAPTSKTAKTSAPGPSVAGPSSKTI